MSNYEMLERVELYMNVARKTAYKKIRSMQLPRSEEIEAVNEICQEVRVAALKNTTATVETVGAKYVELMAKTATRRWSMGVGKRNRHEEDIPFTSFDDILNIDIIPSVCDTFEGLEVEELWKKYGKPVGLSLKEFSDFIYDAPGNYKGNYSIRERNKIRKAIKENTNIHTLKEGK